MLILLINKRIVCKSWLGKSRLSSSFVAYTQISEMPLSGIDNLYTHLQIKCVNDRECQFQNTVQLWNLSRHPTWQEHLSLWDAATNTRDSNDHNFSNEKWSVAIGLPKVIVGIIKICYAATNDSKAVLLLSHWFKLCYIKWNQKRPHHFLFTMLHNNGGTSNSDPWCSSTCRSHLKWTLFLL